MRQHYSQIPKEFSQASSYLKLRELQTTRSYSTISNEPRKSVFAGLRSQINIAGNETSEPPTPARRPIEPVRRKPVGKRRDPNYQAVSTVIRKDIHRRVRVQLVEEGRDLADLLEELISAWLRGKGIKF